MLHDGVQTARQPSVALDLHCKASALWNGMLHGLAPYALSGVVWYQGESNTGRAVEYESLLGCLMHSWRQLFQHPELPFAIVQLANYMEPSAQPQQSQWARLRESQHRAALSDPRAGLAVAIDLGEASDIHPLRKKELAERCALCFDRLVYNKKVTLSPELVSASAESGRVVLSFDQTLAAGAVRGFEVADASGRFRNVEAKASGHAVVLKVSGDVKAVRYAWKETPSRQTCVQNKPACPPFPSRSACNSVRIYTKDAIISFFSLK